MSILACLRREAKESLIVINRPGSLMISFPQAAFYLRTAATLITVGKDLRLRRW